VTSAAGSSTKEQESVSIEIDDLRSQINASVADAANQQQARFEQDFEVATGLLREGLARVAEQSESTLRMVKGTVVELQLLHTDFDDIKASRAGGGASEDLEVLRGTIEAVKQKQGDLDDSLGIVKTDLESMKTSTREELAAVRGEIVELEGRCGATADVQGLRDEVAELRRRSEATVDMVETAWGGPAAPSADEGALRSEIGAVASRLVEQQELARTMQAEVVALSAKLECLAVSTSGGGSYDSADAFQEFALAAKEDEAAEAGAQRRLLLRIDELVDRLAEVDGAVAGIGVGEGVGAVVGLDPEFRRQFEGLVGQVEAMSATELQIQAKFDGFVAQFTQQSPKGRGAAAAVGKERGFHDL